MLGWGGNRVGELLRHAAGSHRAAEGEMVRMGLGAAELR